MSVDFNPFELAGDDPELRTKLTAYVRYQTAKDLRRLLTRRLGVFVLGVAILTVGLHFLPNAALVTTALIAAGMVVLALTNERAARRRLSAELNDAHHE